jgi:hypothetical protein
MFMRSSLLRESQTNWRPMTRTSRPWVTAGLPPDTYEALTDELPASRLWSLLLDVAEARATGRRPAELLEQWQGGLRRQRSRLAARAAAVPIRVLSRE